MNCEPDSESPSELVHDMTQLASSWLNCIEQILKAFRRVAKRFSVEQDDSHNGRILNSEIIRCYAHCKQYLNKLDETYQPLRRDPNRLNSASQLIKEANAELLEPITFKGHNTLTALEAAAYITELLYDKDFQGITSWAEEREDAAWELEWIRMFLDDFSELNTDFFRKLDFKLEQQQIITQKAFQKEDQSYTTKKPKTTLESNETSHPSERLYKPSELKEILGLGGTQLNKYIDGLGLPRAGRGQSNFQFPESHVRIIAEYILTQNPIAFVRDKCSDFLNK
ncbi:hypothetical protein [Gimesia chilikensis]|uniref:hypothetical protein n=1 Tax=Gimesia chilikensis TaxID=2605989 RepID=UPI0011892046|nr:hypothetical protein [Gimesia chilikensis]QDT84774.1 hypothetical protein MalM14_24370 [Gimesia chilikensis]